MFNAKPGEISKKLSFERDASRLPVIPAILANAHAFMCTDGLVPLRPEQLDNEGGEGEEQPFDGKSPPTDEQPPKNAVVFGDQLGLRDHLHVDISTAAFRTSHKIVSSL